MASSERPRAGVGCLGSLLGLLVLVAVVVAVVFVGFIALGIFAALVVVGLVALAVDRVMLALSPRRRERRANQTRMFVWQSGQFRSGQVIDTRAIDTTANAEDRASREQGPSELDGD
jgi:type IV secretory pathway VirB3-like protein